MHISYIYMYVYMYVCVSVTAYCTPLLQHRLSVESFAFQEGQLPRARYGEFSALYGTSKAKESRVLRKAGARASYGHDHVEAP